MRILERVMMGSLMLGATLGAHARSAPEPQPQLQPRPQEAYRLQVHTDEAPDGFDAAQAEVSYRVEKPGCLAWKDRWAGVTVAARHAEPIALHAIDAHTYEGVFYADRLVDQDYYGLGVCHWSVNSVNITLRKGSTAFRPYVFGPIDQGPTDTGVSFLQSEYDAASRGQGPAEAMNTLANRPRSFVVPYFTVQVTTLGL